MPHPFPSKEKHEDIRGIANDHEGASAFPVSFYVYNHCILVRQLLSSHVYASAILNFWIFFRRRDGVVTPAGILISQISGILNFLIFLRETR